ncbi:hypothetical protein BJV74DRAFT_84163 [Russula compacta]|nr:hypothetical protein BJV74DRAFT_84163 [Russula compacta]
MPRVATPVVAPCEEYTCEEYTRAGLSPTSSGPIHRCGDKQPRRQSGGRCANTRLSNLRKPNSASINRSAQGSRKTHPSHGVSRSSGTNDRLVQTQTTGGHMTWRRTMPTLSTFRLHSPRNSGASNAALMAENLALLGLIPFELTRAEATRAKETPGISSVEFYRKFGGGRGMEWLKCHMIPSYADVLCADSSTSQPYVPIDIGKPGLVLRPPAAPQSKRRTFHVFSCSLHDKLLYYRGEYTTVPLPDVQLTWFDIPGTCREAWTKRIAQTVTPAMRAIRARIKLRDELEREPSTTEIEEYLLGRSNVEVTYKEVGSALRAGEEKMVYEGIQCTGYDSNLATLIQRSTGL